jgi:hypothetical protein
MTSSSPKGLEDVFLAAFDQDKLRFLTLYNQWPDLQAESLERAMGTTAEPSIFIVKIGVLKKRNNSGIGKGGMS